MLRDVKADYLAAHLAEFKSLSAAGLHDAAASVAVVLREYYGHEVETAPEPAETVAVPKPSSRRKPTS